ncbi:unnamed protein product [Prunus armeniaca]
MPHILLKLPLSCIPRNPRVLWMPKAQGDEPIIPGHEVISLTNLSKIGYAKYNRKKEGIAKTTGEMMPLDMTTPIIVVIPRQRRATRMGPPQVPLINQPQRQQVAPRASNEKWDLKLLRGEFKESPLKPQDTISAQGMTTP